MPEIIHPAANAPRRAVILQIVIVPKLGLMLDHGKMVEIVEAGFGVARGDGGQFHPYCHWHFVCHSGSPSSLNVFGTSQAQRLTRGPE